MVGFVFTIPCQDYLAFLFINFINMDHESQFKYLMRSIKKEFYYPYAALITGRKHLKQIDEAERPVPLPTTNLFKVEKRDSWKIIKNLLVIGGILILLVLSVAIWYIIVPGVAIWYLWKKTDLTRSIKITLTSLLFIAGAALGYTYRTPSLEITSPQNNTSVQADSITIKGLVIPARSSVDADGRGATVEKDGHFELQVFLLEQNNDIEIKASNGLNDKTVTLRIGRIFTEAEKAERARKAAEQEAARKQGQAEAEAKQQAELEAQQKAQAEAEAKATAEQAVYDNSKAGKLCKQYPDWTKEQCQRVADRNIWVGMTYEMLLAVSGSKPDSANPSNYGGATSWQWCWYNRKPSCFYDNDDDGIIDAYN